VPKAVSVILVSNAFGWAGWLVATGMIWAVCAEPAQAQETAPAPAPAATSAATPAPNSAAAPKAPAGEIRRDPRGVTGVSPVWDSLKLGDNAYLARDYDGAIKLYQEAIVKEPQHPLGHLRMAEALIQKGAFVEAAQATEAAKRFAGNDPTLAARALFLTAWLYEQQQDHDKAIEAWNAYQAFAREQSRAKVFQRTPPERLKRIQEAKQAKQDYAAVRERIEKRLKEADEKAKKSAM